MSVDRYSQDKTGFLFLDEKGPWCSFDDVKRRFLRIEDAQLIKGALDTLGVKLADYGHTWTDGEREIYDQSIEILENVIKQGEP